MLNSVCDEGLCLQELCLLPMLSNTWKVVGTCSLARLSTGTGPREVHSRQDAAGNSESRVCRQMRAGRDVLTGEGSSSSKKQEPAPRRAPHAGRTIITVWHTRERSGGKRNCCLACSIFRTKQRCQSGSPPPQDSLPSCCLSFTIKPTIAATLLVLVIVEPHKHWSE